MNEVISAILSRRSTKKYDGERVSDEHISLIIEAGLYAPSAMNRQNSLMVAVTDKELINKLSKLNAFIMGRDTDPFYGAKTLILVFADRNEKNWLQDGSLVMANIMLAAHSLGIGSCWINRCTEMFETEEGKEIMKKYSIPETFAGVAVCTLGYPDVKKEPAPRKEGRVLFIK